MLLLSLSCYSMSPAVPLVVEYEIENLGNIRYYLAPKIGEGNEGEDEE